MKKKIEERIKELEKNRSEHEDTLIKYTRLNTPYIKKVQEILVELNSIRLRLDELNMLKREISKP